MIAFKKAVLQFDSTVTLDKFKFHIIAIDI